MIRRTPPARARGRQHRGKTDRIRGAGNGRAAHATPSGGAIPAVLIAAVLSGCATVPSWPVHDRAFTDPEATATAPGAALAARPSGVTSPTHATNAPPPGLPDDAALSASWAQLGDPELPALVRAALDASPTLASARGRIERARAERVAADASWLPLVGAGASVQRGVSEPQLPLTRSTTAGVQASWELDLFGAGRAGSAAEAARLAAAQQALQAARLSVAADTALSLVGLRACEAQEAEAQQDLSSHQTTMRVTESGVAAGVLSPDQAALARAAAAQAQAVLGARQAQCERLLRALATLTAIDEAPLRQRLAPRRGIVPAPASAAPEQLPAQLLTRRPDLQEAAFAIAAATHDERAAQAQRWPSVSLQGMLGHARASTAPATFSGQVWTLGPLQLSFPIFDAGVRKARAEAAEATVQEAQALYKARLRKAAEEVENALLTLRSARERELHARQAALSFGMASAAASQRLRGGLASVLEVEQTRRAALAARAAVVELQQSRANAWITLYRVVSGPWDQAAPSRVDVPG